jgi:hypothetical protein
MLAYTYTKHNNITTGYVFAFVNDSLSCRNISFIPSEFGIKGKVAVFAPLSKKLEIVNMGNEFKDSIRENIYSYYILARVNSAGIAFLGDKGKTVETGKKRIADIIDDKGKLLIKVLFAKGESSVELQGYSQNPISCSKGDVKYNPETRMFDLVLPSDGKNEVNVSLK